jgi:hypothetical protein
MTRQHQICRNNASGILMGCHLREHHWQKLRLAIVPRAWSALWARLWRADKTQAPIIVISALGVLFAGLQALGTFTGPL